MTQRLFFSAILCLFVWISTASSASLSTADKATVKEVERFLNGIRSFSASFTQIDAKGGLSRGKFYLDRPGKLRFDYAPPTPLLLVSSGFWLILYDKELQQADRWPINDTPMGMLVAEKISLSGKYKVTNVRREPGIIRLRLIDQDKPDEGSLTLTLQSPGLELRHWQVVDAQGGVTNVTFTDVQRNIKLDPQLFQFEEPDPLNQNNNSGN